MRKLESKRQQEFFSLLKESDKLTYGWVDEREKRKHNKSTT